MNIMLSILVVVLSGALALLCAAFIANACVDWYNISSMEGKAGYFMVGIALLGCLSGILAGLVSNWIVSNSASPGFFKAMGLSWIIVLALSVIAYFVSRSLADIPPEIDGYLLNLELEFQLPASDTGTLEVSDDSYMTLQSMSGRHVRKMQTGNLDFASLRSKKGYWILPGTVYLFTARGRRLIHLVINGVTSASFYLSLPGKPGKKYETWSDWMAHPLQDDLDWQNLSYRFRIQPIMPTPSQPVPKEPDVDEFETLNLESPLTAWLEFIQHDQAQERSNKAMLVIESRQDELAQLIHSDQAEIRERALAAVMRLTHIEPAIISAVLSDGKEIEADIDRFNQMSSSDPEFYDVQIDLRQRFSSWHRAWWNVHRRADVEAREPVQKILDLAAVRAKETSMDEILMNARAHLQGIPKESKEAK